MAEFTEAQKGAFGAKCGERNEEEEKKEDDKTMNANTAKARHVAWLTANCGCFKGKEKLLEQFGEAELTDLVRDHAVARVVNQDGQSEGEERKEEKSDPSSAEDEPGATPEPFAIEVLRIEDGLIAELHYFLLPDLLGRFAVAAPS